jgi:glycosyltransferase involved in cell wall biosynthesis
MKVMILGLRALFGAQGGIETHVRDIVCRAVRLPESTIEFEVIERSPYASAPDAVPSYARSVALTRIWAPRFSHFEALVHSVGGVLWAAVKRPDVLHIHGIGPALVVPLAKAFGLRVVTTHHGCDYNRKKWGWLGRTVLKIGEWCGAIFSDARIVIAPGLDRELLEKYGKSYDYIPNAVPPVEGREPGVLERWSLVPHRYIVNVGRIVPEKRQLALIDAFIAAGHADSRLVLVGGADHGSEYSRQVMERAAQDSRIVLTGALPKSHVNSLYEAAGAFVLPSSHEGLPISLLEAMSFGLPVAISRLPTLAQLDLPENCYVDREDAALLNQVIARLSAPGPAERVDWQKFLRRYSIEQITQQTLDIYGSVAGGDIRLTNRDYIALAPQRAAASQDQTA